MNVGTDESREISLLPYLSRIKNSPNPGIEIGGVRLWAGVKILGAVCGHEAKFWLRFAVSGVFWGVI